MRRQYNLDLLKALSVIAMVICHAVIRLGPQHPGYEQDIPYLIGDYFFGSYLGVAHAFMFAMGVGIVYSRKIMRSIWFEGDSAFIFSVSQCYSYLTGRQNGG